MRRRSLRACLLAASLVGAGLLSAIHLRRHGEEGTSSPARLLAIPVTNRRNPPPDIRAGSPGLEAIRPSGGSLTDLINAAGRPRTTFDAPGIHIVLIIGDEWRLRYLDRTTSIPTRALLPNKVGAPSLIPQDLSVWSATPLDVVLPRADDGGHPAVTALGTGRFPDIIHDLNAMLGFETFRLAARHATRREQERVVRVLPLGTHRRRQGRTRLGRRRCGYDSALGYACRPRWIEWVEVGFTATAGPAEVQHELLHALGLTHTCVVPSVMATEFEREELERCGRMRRSLRFDQPLKLTRQMSEFDVAAIEILRNVARALEGRSGVSLYWVIVPSSEAQRR